MKPNKKQAYLPVNLETVRWDEKDDIITTSGGKGIEGPGTNGHTVPAYTRYEEDESED